MGDNLLFSQVLLCSVPFWQCKCCLYFLYPNQGLSVLKSKTKKATSILFDKIYSCEIPVKKRNMMNWCCINTKLYWCMAICLHSLVPSPHLKYKEALSHWSLTFLPLGLFWKCEETFLFEVIFCMSCSLNVRMYRKEMKEKRLRSCNKLKSAERVKQVGEKGGERKLQMSAKRKGSYSRGEGETKCWEKIEKRQEESVIVWVCPLRANNISLLLSLGFSHSAKQRGKDSKSETQSCQKSVFFGVCVKEIRHLCVCFVWRSPNNVSVRATRTLR